MPDLPTSDPAKDWTMFQDVLHGDELQADHWKIYPCEVTPFTKIETWYKEGRYVPYTEQDPKLLIDLLAKVKAEVHPWIRLNRVIRDIPEVSIIAGNANTNLRQCIFEELKKRGKSCRCIRCREVRDWPETPEGLRLRIREYRSSDGTEYFISIEGSNRGLGGGATQRALGGGQKATKKEKNNRKKLARGEAQSNADMIGSFAAALSDKTLTREERKAAAEAALAERAKAQAAVRAESIQEVEEDIENATLYGLLRLRFNDDPTKANAVFPELIGCAMIRELHVYGKLVAAGRSDDQHVQDDERPQHIGIGRTLMGTAELIAAANGWSRISVISGVGVRNYYRKLGYELKGKGQYLIKELPACRASDKGRSPQSFEASFIEAGTRVQALKLHSETWLQSHTCKAVVASVSIAALTLGAMAFSRHCRRSSS
jgi:histone acetyltransferase (RNA polymerase elongator complex component)